MKSVVPGFEASSRLLWSVEAFLPFSNKAWSNDVNVANDPYGRFGYGIPPAKNGDYAFLLHILASLKNTGKGAVIHPHGVLFRGNAEADIRKRIIRQGFIKGIIGLPANLFYGTGIPACLDDCAPLCYRTGGD
jgi:type I restriction enzyme M protein